MIVFFITFKLINIYCSDTLYLWSKNKINNFDDKEFFNNKQEYLFNLINSYEKVKIYITHNECILKNLNCSSNILLNELSNKFYEWNNIILFENLQHIIKEIPNDELEFLYDDLPIYDINSKISIIHLPENKNNTKLFLNEDKLSGVLYILYYESSKKSIVNTRSDIVIVPPKTKGLVDDGVFLNFNDCVYLYLYGSLIYYNSLSVKLPANFYTVDNSESLCSDTHIKLSMIILNSSPYEKVKMTMNFSLMNNMWQCIDINVHLIPNITNKLKEDEITFDCHKLTGRKKISYTCPHIKFYPKIFSREPYLVFNFIQVQPFVSASNNLKFGYADSCSTFITVTILMGILVTIFIGFISIYCLIYLSNIKGNIRVQNIKENVLFGNTMK